MRHIDYTSIHFALPWAVGMGILWLLVLFAIPVRFSHHPVTVFIRRAFPVVIAIGLYPFAHLLFLKGLP